VRYLWRFFADYNEWHFNRALGALCRFYQLPRPRVVWFERLADPRRGGECFENGTIHLTHPENWKKNRKYNSREQWVQLVLHELGHHAMWSETRRLNAEHRADRFAATILKGAA
jgi:predicted SprT family Zn-dependent metalloprotease